MTEVDTWETEHLQKKNKPPFNENKCGLAITSLILGIIAMLTSWIFFGALPGLLAIIFSVICLVKRNGIFKIVIAALILGILSLLIMALVIVAVTPVVEASFA